MVPKTLAQDANACVALAAADTGVPRGTLLFGTASGESHLGVPTHPLRVLGVGVHSKKKGRYTSVYGFFFHVTQIYRNIHIPLRIP